MRYAGRPGEHHGLGQCLAGAPLSGARPASLAPPGTGLPARPPGPALERNRRGAQRLVCGRLGAAGHRDRPALRGGEEYLESGGGKGSESRLFCFPKRRAVPPPPPSSFSSAQADFVYESGMFHPPASRAGRLIWLDRFCRRRGRRGGDRRLVFLGKARPDRAFPLEMLPRLFQSEQDIASIEKYREDRSGTLQARGSCS